MALKSKGKLVIKHIIISCVSKFPSTTNVKVTIFDEHVSIFWSIVYLIGNIT